MPSLNRTVIPSFRIQNVKPLHGRGQMLEEGQVLRRPLLSPPGKQIGPVRATRSFLPFYHHHQQPVAVCGDPDNHSEVRGNQLRPDARCDVGPSGVPTTIGQHNTPDPEECPYVRGRSMFGPLTTDPGHNTRQLRCSKLIVLFFLLDFICYFGSRPSTSRNTQPLRRAPQ